MPNSRAIAPAVAAAAIIPESVRLSLDTVLGFWEMNLASATPAKLRASRDAMEGVIRSGMGRVLLQEMARPATDNEIALAAARIRVDIPPRQSEHASPAASLAEELKAAKPPILALQAAVGRLRRTCTFPPAIAEVLAAVTAEADLLATRRALVERLPGRIQEADRILGTCKN